MDLEEELKTQISENLIFMELNHCSDHNISSASLNRSVDSSSESMLFHSILFPISFYILGKVFSQISISAQQSLSPTFLNSYFLNCFLPLANFWSISVPQVYCVFCFFNRTIPVLHESVDSLTISNRKIHYFSFFPFVCIFFFEKRYRRLTFRVVPFQQQLP